MGASWLAKHRWVLCAAPSESEETGASQARAKSQTNSGEAPRDPPNPGKNVVSPPGPIAEQPRALAPKEQNYR